MPGINSELYLKHVGKECRLCEEYYPLISMTKGICSMCIQLHSKSEVIGMLED